MSKTSSNINQLVYYLLKLYCNKTMDKTYNFPKETTYPKIPAIVPVETALTPA